MELEKLKQHVRVDHSFEDDLIRDYLGWAEAEVKDSVTTAPDRNESYFEGNPHYERAVALLTSHYFENRLPMVETTMHNLPFGITSAIHKLRGGYHEEQ